MLVISDRVKESSISEGSGSITLDAPFGSFQSFSQGIGSGNTTYYCIENGTRWEVGQGVYSSAGNTLSRDVIFDSSAGGAKINLEGVSVIFCTLPADRAIIQNENGHTFVSGISTLQLNASGVETQNLSVSGQSQLEEVTISGNLASLGQFIYGGDLANINKITTSGDIHSSGLLTLVRPLGDDGNFLHAYKNDGTKQTLALHVDSQLSPLWKFGLKTNPNNEQTPPTFGYVFARDGVAGMVGDLENYFSISDGLGFTVQNEAHNVMRVSSLTGVYLEINSSVNPSFVITGPPLNIEDLTQWRQSDETILSVVDSGGKFGILMDSPLYELDVNGSGRMETIYLTSGIYFQDGTFQSTTAAPGSLQTVTDNGSITDNQITINANFAAVSGSLSGIDFTPLSEANYPPHQEGRIFFDAENHTISMYGEKSDVSLQIGQEQHLRVRNTNSYTLKNGSGVYLTGSQGTHPTVDYAIASGENTSHVVGLATHDIEPNSFGYITTYGIVRNVNTGAFSDGDELYLSAENSGVLVNISPIAPNYKSTIGHVIKSHPTNGTILVANEGVKLGGGDAKTLRNIGVSGIAFFEGVTPDGNAGVLASDADFYYDSGNDRLHIGAGGIRFNDGTTQTTAGGGGGGNRTYTNITADYSMSASDDVVFANSTSGPLNVYIPTAGGVGGKEVTIKTTAGSDPVTVVASGSELIDGQSSMTLYSRYESITLISNNTNWFIT